MIVTSKLGKRRTVSSEQTIMIADSSYVANLDPAKKTLVGWMLLLVVSFPSTSLLCQLYEARLMRACMAGYRICFIQRIATSLSTL
jgi:hypothetical protein